MNKRILVVEDQPDNRQIIRDMLAPTDYEITEAGDRPLKCDLNVIFFQLPGVALGTRKAHEAAGIHHISWWRGYRMAARARAAD
jgi:CheY-like chemotaxis protein